MKRGGTQYSRVIGSLLPEIIKRHVQAQQNSQPSAVDTDPTVPLGSNAPPSALAGTDKPWCETIWTVALFADVSGFTMLSEKLAKKGPVGCEELGRYLNKYLELLGL